MLERSASTSVSSSPMTSVSSLAISASPSAGEGVPPAGNPPAGPGFSKIRALSLSADLHRFGFIEGKNVPSHLDCAGCAGPCPNEETTGGGQCQGCDIGCDGRNSASAATRDAKADRDDRNRIPGAASVRITSSPADPHRSGRLPPRRRARWIEDPRSKPSAVIGPTPTAPPTQCPPRQTERVHYMLIRPITVSPAHADVTAPRSRVESGLLEGSWPGESRGGSSWRHSRPMTRSSRCRCCPQRETPSLARPDSNRHLRA